MRDNERIDPSAERAHAANVTSNLAVQRMDYTIWKHGTDVHDISDGPFPLGERMTVVNSLSLAVGTAKIMMRQDPTIAFIDLVPKRPSMFCKSVRVRPKKVYGAGRQTLDPNEGLEHFKGVG
jgi:hypothetical protein